MPSKVTKFSTEKLNFGLNAQELAQIKGLTELNNYYIGMYGLK